jgi:hypothetical protein
VTVPAEAAGNRDCSRTSNRRLTAEQCQELRQDSLLGQPSIEPDGGAVTYQWHRQPVQAGGRHTSNPGAALQGAAPAMIRFLARGAPANYSNGHLSRAARYHPFDPVSDDRDSAGHASYWEAMVLILGK